MLMCLCCPTRSFCGVISGFDIALQQLNIYSYSPDYPGPVRWQHLLAPRVRLVELCSVDVATWAALSHNNVQTLIVAQANYEIKTK